MVRTWGAVTKALTDLESMLFARIQRGQRGGGGGRGVSPGLLENRKKVKAFLEILVRTHLGFNRYSRDYGPP